MPDQERDQVNLLEVLTILVRWRKMILTAAVGVALVVAVISLVVTPRFKSTAVVRIQQSQGGGGIGSLISSKLGGLGALAGLAGSFGESTEEVLMSILRSRWLSDKVIEKFELRKVYKMEKETQEEVVKLLQKRTLFDLEDKSLNIIINVYDQSPQRAKEMADFYVDELDQRNQELRSTTARKEREFIGARLDAERGQLTMLEDSLFRFQTVTGVLDIEEQTKATIQTAAALEAQRLTAKAKLELNRQVLGATQPETEFTRLQVASIDSSIRSLIASGQNGDTDFLVALKDVPAHGLQYLRLKRDIEIQQLLTAYLIQQFEQAKVEELRNTPTLIRVDPPTVASKRSWPKRSLMVIVAFAAACFFAAAVALFLEFFRKASTDSAHPQYQTLVNLRRSWKTRE